MRIEELKKLDILNGFYKIKCDAFFIEEKIDDFIIVLLCTIHDKHYFIFIHDEIQIKLAEDYMDLFFCFDNNLKIKGYVINEELILAKNEKLFDCNFFEIIEEDLFGFSALTLIKKIDFSKYQMEPLIKIAKNIYKDEMPFERGMIC